MVPNSSLFLKMLLAKTQYKTHNGEFLAIIKALKTWRCCMKNMCYLELS